jgi:hypothetical protein
MKYAELSVRSEEFRALGDSHSLAELGPTGVVPSVGGATSNLEAMHQIGV